MANTPQMGAEPQSVGVVSNSMSSKAKMLLDLYEQGQNDSEMATEFTKKMDLNQALWNQSPETEYSCLALLSCTRSGKTRIEPIGGSEEVFSECFSNTLRGRMLPYDEAKNQVEFVPYKKDDVSKRITTKLYGCEVKKNIKNYVFTYRISRGDASDWKELTLDFISNMDMMARQLGNIIQSLENAEDVKQFHRLYEKAWVEQMSKFEDLLEEEGGPIDEIMVA